MYDKIMNPKTGRYVLIYGKMGKSIIKKYLNYFIGGTSKDDIPMNNYESLKYLSYEEFARQIEKLYSNAKLLQIKSFDRDDVDKGLNSFGFDIKRIHAPGVTAHYNGGGIFVDSHNNIIKMMSCPMYDRPNCKQRYFINEIYWMVNLYKMGLSPEFISVDFVKLEFDGKVNLYCLAKLKNI